jgi:multiple antibiotic resistance protein
MNLFSIAFSLFLLMDSIGNVPLYLSILKNFNPKRQRIIILREMTIALLIIIAFVFLGDKLMTFLQISDSTIQISGGIVLFLICLKMIFPSKDDPQEHVSLDEEPLVVPLAVPFVAGPAVLAAVMIYARQEMNYLLMIGAIAIAWAASLIILLASSFLKNILGIRGLTAIERLMGLILILISVQMFLTGLHSFTKI